MTRILALVVCIVVFYNYSYGQHKRLLHQTFEIQDSVKEIHLDVFGKLQIESWAGNLLMGETEVEVERASTGLFNYLITQGRYQLKATSSDTSVILIITSKIAELDTVKVRIKNEKTFAVEDVNISEQLRVKLFIPDAFEPTATNPLIWRRKPDPLTPIIKTTSDSIRVEPNRQ